MKRTFRSVRGTRGLDELEDSWEELTSRNPHARYFHRYAWIRAYLDCLEDDPDSMLFVVAVRGDSVEAIFPFRVTRSLVPVLEVPRHLHMNLQDIVLDAKADREGLLSELFAYLKTRKDLGIAAVHFGRVLQDSAAFQLINADESLRRTCFEVECNHVVPAMSRDGLFAHVSKNMRYNLRKAERKLSRHDSVEFSSSRDPSTLPDFLRHFMDIEASGWKGEYGERTAIKLHPELLGFYEQLTNRFGASGNCEINLLKIDGEYVAGQFALIVGEVIYILKIGYDERFRKLGPGNLLEAHTNCRLHAEGVIRRVNFITGVEWHSSWRPECHRAYEVCCYRPSVVGTLLFAYRHARHWLGHLRHKIQSSLKPGRTNNKRTPPVRPWAIRAVRRR